LHKIFCSIRQLTREQRFSSIAWQTREIHFLNMQLFQQHATWLKQDVCCGFNRQRTGNVMLIQLPAFAAF